MRRAAGVLLHPTSLPNPFGVGDLGPEAESFLDWARDAGQSWWQILPLGPPEAGNSPYTCLSAFAGNPLLISPERLHRQGLLTRSDLEAFEADLGPEDAPSARVDFERVNARKDQLLRRSWERFQDRPPAELGDRLAEFCEAPEQRFWLDDWGLFAALSAHHDRRGWWQWEPEVARREPSALGRARDHLAGEIAFHRYLQFLFTTQWHELRQAAHARSVRILGDLPIYVALNSAEVWAHRELFDLDDGGWPRAVAGVPPDQFSDTGQLWGNPLYRWDRMAERGFDWWIERLAANLRLTDRVRLDHFRAFAAYWRVPSGEPTAQHGEWVEGPGDRFFQALGDALGELPLIAEDLGVITPDVDALRLDHGLPGMKVLQFAFDEPDSTHLPHHFETSSVVYTGTHDNDTTVSWHRQLAPEVRARVESYSGAQPSNAGCHPTHGDEPHWALIRLAWTSVAELAIVPVQDVLGLGGEARMNTPAIADGNWGWRLEGSALTPELAGRLRALTEVSGRLPAADPAPPESEGLT